MSAGRLGSLSRALQRPQAWRDGASAGCQGRWFASMPEEYRQYYQRAPALPRPSSSVQEQPPPGAAAASMAPLPPTAGSDQRQAAQAGEAAASALASTSGQPSRLWHAASAHVVGGCLAVHGRGGLGLPQYTAACSKVQQNSLGRHAHELRVAPHMNSQYVVSAQLLETPGLQSYQYLHDALSGHVC